MSSIFSQGELDRMCMRSGQATLDRGSFHDGPCYNLMLCFCQPQNAHEFVQFNKTHQMELDHLHLPLARAFPRNGW